jgi:hypothetical protein
VLDESAGVACLAGLAAQKILEGSERANPTAKFDRRAPDSRRNVQRRETPPPDDQQSAHDDEDDERRMEYRDSVGEHTIAHSESVHRADTTIHGVLELSRRVRRNGVRLVRSLPEWRGDYDGRDSGSRK